MINTFWSALLLDARKGQNRYPRSWFSVARLTAPEQLSRNAIYTNKPELRLHNRVPKPKNDTSRDQSAFLPRSVNPS